MNREQTTIRIPVKLKETIKIEAKKRGFSFNALILMILNEERNHHQT